MKKGKSLLMLASVAMLLSACGGNNPSPSSDSSVSSGDISSSISSSSSQKESSSSVAPTNPEEGLQTIMTSFSGSFSYKKEDNTITSSTKRLLTLCDNSVLTKGTLTTYLTPNEVGCNGIIFNVNKGSKIAFWEDVGVSYYFFFIDENGTARLAKVDNGNWINLPEKPIEGYSINNTYKLDVSLDTTGNKTIINCFVNDTFYYSYKDENKITGYSFGLRMESKSVGTRKNSVMKCIDKSNLYKEEERSKAGDYYIAAGSFAYNKQQDAYTSSVPNAIMFKEDNFGCGSIETSMMVPNGAPSCNGIIFALDNSDQSSFWEAGVSYYFFFIDESGYARLSKVNYGTWSDLCISDYPVAGFTILTNTYKLKMERDSTVINCYVDDVKYLSFVDSVPLLGTYYGFRAGSPGTKYKNINIIKGGDIEYKDPTYFDVPSGKYVTSNDEVIISKGTNNIALHKTTTLENGTLTVNFNENTAYKAGVIFRSDDVAANYYVFTIEGNYACLGKVVNGAYTPLTNNKFVTASHRPGSDETMIISIDGDTIRCYLRGILYAIYSDNNMLTGTRCGYYAANSASVFKSFKVEGTIYKKTADTLIFGHSYMELWSNYASDLNKFNDIYNIGIGGSVAEQWKEFKAEIADYNPTTLILMIGTNDVFAYQPSQVVDFVKDVLDYLKTTCPNLTTCALISCNRCPLREDYVQFISTLNAKYKDLVLEEGYSWVKYADIDNAFMKGASPDPSCFVDGLHPTAEAYLVIRNAIYQALGMDD